MNRIRQLDPFTAVLDMDAGDHTIAHRVAGLGARILAGILDSLIVAFPIVGAGFLLLAAEKQTPVRELIFALSTGYLGSLLLYHTLFEIVVRGETPGKSACGIRVVSQTGRRATAIQILVRNLLRTIDWLPAIYGIGGLASFLDKNARRLGDRAAGTMVIYSDRISHQLARAHVPPSVYSTSEDGYLLEAMQMRAPALGDEMRESLTEQLAHHLFKVYPPDRPELLSAYNSGRYADFLRELYRVEREAALDAPPENE
ncbi:MAG: RDD family protein [Candidatus Sumerlaeaceae bacterium]|nr:RDD family protein [Candidatus Sumerlaeaceae bacterium]